MNKEEKLLLFDALYFILMKLEGSLDGDWIVKFLEMREGWKNE